MKVFIYYEKIYENIVVQEGEQLNISQDIKTKT